MPEELQSIIGALPLLIPLFMLQLVLIVVALIDVIRRERVRGNKIVWIIVIVAVNIIGPIIYLLFGRQEAPNDRD